MKLPRSKVAELFWILSKGNRVYSSLHLQSVISVHVILCDVTCIFVLPKFDPVSPTVDISERYCSEQITREMYHFVCLTRARNVVGFKIPL